MQLIVDSEKDLDKTAKEIIKCSEEENIWIFYGEMGAGKTTLIKAIADQLDIEDNVHSPTFSIV
ncbi:MAG: tRNA (adenosine(37)-N6)-threonylcarbamoyltransferase complex ATPase subunit type 1 TsaE, partial [Cyclobacteriaceae bacterium]|nr:tRNA (adenosine(37)-N6)-threonylcarbamoyltransferase complex ATPase subunit type 1 TsaE [Cyclobacteriaceae bacterium]